MRNLSGLSASAIESHNWCEWKYFLNYTVGLEDPPGGAAILGHIAHKIFEVMSLASIKKVRRDHKVFDLNKMWEVWYNYYYLKNPLEMSKIKDDKLSKLCRGMVELVSSDFSPIRDNTICAEQYFKIPLEDKRFKNPDGTFLTVRGVIDRIDKIDDDTIEIVDYKTGTRGGGFSSDSKEKKNEISLRDSIQPQLYHLACRKLFPEVKNILVTFIYITDGGPITTVWSEDDVHPTYEYLYKKSLSIKMDEPTRNKTWRCRFCPYSTENLNLCDKIWEEKNETNLEFVTNKYFTIKPPRK